MGSLFAQALFAMLLIASMVAVSTANKDWQNGNYSGWGYNHGPYHLNKTNGSNKIVVGGSEKWHYGFNYADWSLKNSSFYVQDTLGEFHMFFCSSFKLRAVAKASKVENLLHSYKSN
jgi:hypothetical protein